MTVAVRRATNADADVIAALNAEVQDLHANALPGWFKPAGPQTFPSEQAAALIAMPSSIVFLAERDAIPVGYAYAEVVAQPETAWRYAQSIVYVHQIGVRAEQRRQGIGAALLGAIRAEAERLGVTTVALDVWTFNEAARAFFRRQGFEPYNERLWSR
jgi:diamine N-acetyltransferase